MNQNNEKVRRERFRRIATRRTNEILNRIRVLGNCANKSAYSYSEEEVKKIFSTIDGELKTVKARFVNKKKSNFTL